MKRILHVLICLIMVVNIAACGSRGGSWQEQYDLGVKYLSEGNYEEAILAFSAAIEIDPKAVDSYWGRAEAYAKSGDELSAWVDVKQIVVLTEDITEVQDKLDVLGAMFKDPAIFDSLVKKYVEEIKPEAAPTPAFTPEPTETPEEILEEVDLGVLLEEYTGTMVTHERFHTCTGIDVVPYPAGAKGMISGYMLDLNQDGTEELITAWSDGNGIYVKLSESGSDGLREVDSERMLSLDYSKNIQAAIYHRPATGQWLVAAAEFTYGSYTGYRGFLCKLYQVDLNGFTLLNTWEQNNMLGMVPENLDSELEAVQWPIEDGNFIFDLNTGKLDSLSYLVKLDSYTDGGADEFALTDDIHYQQFQSPAQLAELAQSTGDHGQTESAALSAYLPILENALTERGEEYLPGGGFFFDLDGDGSQEMVFEQMYMEMEGQAFPCRAYNVYAIENGRAVSKVYRSVLFPDAGGPGSRVAAALYEGRTVLEVMVDNGETGGGGAQRESETTLYDGKTLEPVVSITKAYREGTQDYSDNQEHPYAWTLNGAECTEDEYNRVAFSIERYITTSTWNDSDPLKGMELLEMVNYVSTAG